MLWQGGGSCYRFKCTTANIAKAHADVASVAVLAVVRLSHVDGVYGQWEIADPSWQPAADWACQKEPAAGDSTDLMWCRKLQQQFEKLPPEPTASP